MLLEAACALDVQVEVLAESAADAASQVWGGVQYGSGSVAQDLRAFAEVCDVMTFDHEHVDVAMLEQLERSGVTVRPSAKTMSFAQDKGRQRAEFESAGLPVPAWRLVVDATTVQEFAQTSGWPVILKALRGGYDGRGVWVAESLGDAEHLVAAAHDRGHALLVEERVDIDCELAVLVARRPSGETVTYPALETVQVDGICREVLGPARVASQLAEHADVIARQIAELVDSVGMLAVEFLVSQDRVLVNEIAARPHNSGHLTIEGAITSQFEQHLRAVLDWPLGETALTAPWVAMANVIGSGHGDPAAQRHRALAVPAARVHLYGKQARPGRKLGHVTVCGEEFDDVRARALHAAELLMGVDGA